MKTPSDFLAEMGVAISGEREAIISKAIAQGRDVGYRKGLLRAAEICVTRADYPKGMFCEALSVCRDLAKAVEAEANQKPE